MAIRIVPIAFALSLSACWELPPFETDTTDDSESSTNPGDDSDNEAVTCDENQCLISGSITSNQHWTADNRYILRGPVLLGDGEHETRLTIDPGTHIYGERQTTGMLVVQRNAKLYAEGTASSPIVFSSDQPTGQRRRGDWGGIVINGNAPINECEQTDPCAMYGEGGTGWYGGEDSADDSGVLRYVRIEYAGGQFGPTTDDNGGLSLRGVGAGTTVDRLHLHLNQNDGIGVVGGSVDLKYVLSTGSSDDGLAWTGGWRGRGQYIVTQQYEDGADNGIEGANSRQENTSTPISSPTLFNITLVGAPTGQTDGIGLLLSEGTAGTFRNTLVMGFDGACFDIDHEATWHHADKGELSFHDGILHCDTPFMENKAEEDPANASIPDFFYSSADNHCADPRLVSPFSRTEPDFAPGLGSPANGGSITPADGFFDGVSFIGGVNPEDDWTREAWIANALSGIDDPEGFTDPVAVENTLECTGEVCVASGTYTSDMHWTADKLYLLRGGVFIGTGEKETTLEIDPGTEIRGESATTGFLVIQRNAKISAVATPDKPIVFTSDKPVGSRARGDWGGLILNGNAPINGCNASVCESWGEGGTGWYGGGRPDDSSGALRYVRIEFAGKQLGPDNELNGLTLQGVGSKTELSYLHLHMNKDDAVEFFGGTADIRYVLATGTGDDNLDWTQGWQGRVQFFVAQQYWDAGDNGIEADNNGADNAAEPFSHPVIANFTLIGVPTGDASDLGILLREGTRGRLYNGVVTGFGDACLDVDHSLTWQHVDAGLLRLEGVILNCAVSFKDNYVETDPENVSLQSFFEQGTGNRIGDPGLDDPFERETPHFAPKPKSAAADGSVALPADPFFHDAPYLGAVDPEDDWVSRGVADGWITFYAL